MLGGSLAFAVMGTMAHVLGASCDWRIIALTRTCLALILAAGLALAAGARLVFWGPRILWVRSLAGSISLVCTFFAFTHLPVSDVLTLTNLFPVWVALLSWPVLKEPPSAQVWLAVAGSVLGLCLIQQPHLAQGNFASLIALASSVTTAVAMIGLHRLVGIDPRAIVVHFSGVSILFCLASLFPFDAAAQISFIPQVWSLVMLLGVGVSATIGQLFLTRAFAAGPPSRVSVVSLTQVVFAMILEVFLLGRSFDPLSLLGIALVLGSAAWLMTTTHLPRKPCTTMSGGHKLTPETENLNR
jgi:drug/metabolite transporter (DMT)-like permease